VAQVLQTVSHPANSVIELSSSPARRISAQVANFAFQFLDLLFDRTNGAADLRILDWRYPPLKF
jgi:hypothetical protein